MVNSFSTISEIKLFFSTNSTTEFLLIIFYSRQDGPSSNLISILTNFDRVLSLEKCFLLGLGQAEIENSHELCEKFEIESVPTSLIVSKDLSAISKIEGYDPVALVDAIKMECDISVPLKRCLLPNGLLERISSLIEEKSLMLFIKGTPSRPQCGFTQKLISLLSNNGILEGQYGYFDILKDEPIRQGIKLFSDWPTFPQVYIRGNLVGGLDIVSELLNSESVFDEFKPRSE